MSHFRVWLALTAAMLASLGASSAQAGIMIEGTRVVYPAQAREVSVNLRNADKERPRLVQVWIDDGHEDLAPEQAEAPFNITPPVFRMEAGTSQSLRLVYTGEPLPADQESLYWLNVREVPPKPHDADGRNTLQFAFRIRIKLFFRPKGLPGSAKDAPKQLIWAWVKDGASQILEVRNPTPYYVSFQSVALMLADKPVKLDAPNNNRIDMVAPHGSLRFPLMENVGPLPANVQVHFSTITDIGSFAPGSAPLKSAS